MTTVFESESGAQSGNVWGLILAAGEGTRLRSLTTTVGGLTVPKQFCSLQGGASLLEEALVRGQAVALPHHVTTVVADHHRRWWNLPLAPLPPDNVVIQPENKGTAAGLLLPLLHILQRDPDAVVVVLPADHFVREEAVLAGSLRHATQLARTDPRHVYLLGIAPERPDPELGYIVPGARLVPGAAPVRRFVEKPTPGLAHTLIEHGALWNAFILAGSARAILRLYENRHSALVASLGEAVHHDARRPQDSAAARSLYPSLRSLDFSKDVLEGQEALLRVVRVPNCGWNDLGTPERVAETLSHHRSCHRTVAPRPESIHLSLADQHCRQRRAV